MASLDWQLTHAGDTTLVELLVTSGTDARVEITSNLQPVWPPRRRGRPAAGWTETGFVGVVPADEVLVLGYASPADPVEPPATIVETQPVADTPEEPPTPQALVRSLGEAGPPRDAVPVAEESSPLDQSLPTGDSPQSSGQRPTDTRSAADAYPGSGCRDRSQSADSAQQPADDQPPSVDSTPQASSDGSRTTDVAWKQSSGDHTPPEQSPGEAMGVGAWLDRVEQRLDTAEQLAAAESVVEARAAVDAAGGIDAVRRLCEDLSADRNRLEVIETHGKELGQRLAEVDVPLSALERLA